MQIIRMSSLNKLETRILRDEVARYHVAVAKEQEMTEYATKKAEKQAARQQAETARDIHNQKLINGIIGQLTVAIEKAVGGAGLKSLYEQSKKISEGKIPGDVSSRLGSKIP